MPANYTLNIFTSVPLGETAIGDITHIATGWRRSVSLKFGCKSGQFRIYPNNGLAINDLKQFFYNWMGNVIVERSGGVKTWSGLVYSMDWNFYGDVRRKTFENSFNAVKAAYIDETDTYAETSWYTNSNSIGYYGRKENIFELDGYPQATAEARCQKELKLYGWPFAQMVGMTPNNQAWLDVRVLGWSATANWRYVTAADDGTGNADVWIDDILSTDCEFLTAADIQTNTVQVKRTNKIYRRALDTMADIVELGGPSYEPWQLWIDPDRMVYYRPVDLSVKYNWFRGGQLRYIAGGDVNPFTVEPGVVRDTEYPRDGGRGSDALLSDFRDVLVDEVEVSADGTIYLKSSMYEENDILVAQAEYEKMLNRENADE